MRSFDVTVTQIVRVTMDETKFTPEFFAEYVRHFSPKDDLISHADHIGWLQATGREDMEGSDNPFVEGYGPVDDFGIKAKVIDTETEVELIA